jgi:predicted nucleotidyltransferase
LLIAWLSEKIQYEISNEEVGLEALKVAEAAVMYQSKYAFSFENMIQTIREFLQKDGRISVAYLFGSFARGENTTKSDVDICVEFNDKKKYSLFDLIDISHILEKGVHRKVDIVEKGSIKDFALQSASNDFIKIYG